MEDDIPVISRFRNQNFRENEVSILLQLVSKYKAVVLNKSSAYSACHAKDQAWEKITEEFNVQCTEMEREAQVLRTKWDNLKRRTRMLMNQADFDPNKDHITGMVVSLIADEPQFQTPNITQMEASCTNKTDWAALGVDDTDWPCGNQTLNDEFKEIDKKQEINSAPLRRSKLTPKECRILLNLVKEEKDVVFSNKSYGKKQTAWKKITEMFNKQSQHKRTVTELSKSFQAMKNVTRKVNMAQVFNKEKYETLNDSNNTVDQNIKAELMSDSSNSSDDTNLFEMASSFRATHDPLGGNAHSSDSGLGIPETRSTKEINRLKEELLNYEMETAKMQRQRLQQAIEAEKRERELRAVEISLKLRTARLELLAAEAKFDTNSPALAYTAQEIKCQDYMRQCLN